LVIVLKTPVCRVLDLLEDPRFGLREIKDEVKDIERALGALTPVKGPLSTGPFFIPCGQKVAVTANVQNVGRGCIDVEVKLFDIECCPPKEVDCKLLRDIGRCCAEDAVLCASEGIFEVVFCPKPDHAAIRAFVAVHEGHSSDSEAEYVIMAADMLPVVCPFCKKDRDRCRRDRCEDDCDS
jgi:hypothetical protein